MGWCLRCSRFFLALILSIQVDNIFTIVGENIIGAPKILVLYNYLSQYWSFLYFLVKFSLLLDILYFIFLYNSFSSLLHFFFYIYCSANYRDSNSRCSFSALKAIAKRNPTIAVAIAAYTNKSNSIYSMEMQWLVYDSLIKCTQNTYPGPMNLGDFTDDTPKSIYL